jgi:hypothetical protein
MPYTIRFEGIGSTSIVARSADDAAATARHFEALGMTEVVIADQRSGQIFDLTQFTAAVVSQAA